MIVSLDISIVHAKGEDSMIVTERYSNPTEIAARLGKATATVLRWIRDGRLKATRPGREWLVEEKDFQEFLQRRSNQQVPEQK